MIFLSWSFLRGSSTIHSSITGMTHFFVAKEICSPKSGCDPKIVRLHPNWIKWGWLLRRFEQDYSLKIVGPCAKFKDAPHRSLSFPRWTRVKHPIFKMHVFSKVHCNLPFELVWFCNTRVVPLGHCQKPVLKWTVHYLWSSGLEKSVLILKKQQ